MKFTINPKPLVHLESVPNCICVDISDLYHPKLGQFLDDLFGPDTTGTGCTWNYLLINRDGKSYIFQDHGYDKKCFTEITQQEALQIGDMHGYDRF